VPTSASLHPRPVGHGGTTAKLKGLRSFRAATIINPLRLTILILIVARLSSRLSRHTRNVADFGDTGVLIVNPWDISP
jgi:hypothetical protein